MAPPAANTPTAGEGEPPRVLVTGGAGFIGSHLVERLLARGDHVTVVDNLSTGRRDNLPDEHPRLRFIEADLSDALRAFGPGERFDRIHHLAAAVGVDLVLSDPIGSIETNVDQTAALLRFASGTDGESGVPTLIASSSEVYGKPDRETFSEEDDVVYGPTSITRWSYAASKAIDEHLALAYHRSHGLPVVVVRFFNTVGPRQLGSYGMVLPRFVRAALDGEPLRVFGDGTQSRCFCDVRDVADALPTLLDTPACAGRVFNLGSDRPIGIGELARRVIEWTGSRSTVQHVPYSEAYPPGFEDLKRRRPDLARVRDAVGFEALVGLEQTVRDLAATLEQGTSGEGRRGDG